MNTDFLGIVIWLIALTFALNPDFVGERVAVAVKAYNVEMEK